MFREYAENLLPSLPCSMLLSCVPFDSSFSTVKGLQFWSSIEHRYSLVREHFFPFWKVICRIITLFIFFLLKTFLLLVILMDRETSSLERIGFFEIQLIHISDTLSIGVNKMVWLCSWTGTYICVLFHVSVTKYLRRSMYMRKGLFVLQFEGIQSASKGKVQPQQSEVTDYIVSAVGKHTPARKRD